jgi:hypothetical protein
MVGRGFTSLIAKDYFSKLKCNVNDNENKFALPSLRLFSTHHLSQKSHAAFESGTFQVSTRLTLLCVGGEHTTHNSTKFPQSQIYFKMISALFVLASVVSTVSASADIVPTYGGEIVYQGDFPDLIVNPTDFGKGPLPTAWDWRKLGLMTTDLNQHIPQYW